MAERSERCQTDGVPRRTCGTVERANLIAFGDRETGLEPRFARETTPPRAIPLGGVS
jgi:hypothetical protein